MFVCFLLLSVVFPLIVVHLASRRDVEPVAISRLGATTSPRPILRSLGYGLVMDFYFFIVFFMLRLRAFIETSKNDLTSWFYSCLN